MSPALLFDDEAARQIDADGLGEALTGEHLVWVELDRDNLSEFGEIAGVLGVDDEMGDAIGSPSTQARIEDFRSHLHVTVVVPEGPEEDLLQVDCLVGESWLITVGPREADAIRVFRDRVTGRGELGKLDAPSFLAALLEWSIEGYLEAFDAVEAELEEVDVGAMRAADDTIDETLERLVALRRRTGRLRRALGGHRLVVVALAHPEFDAISTPASSERFQRVLERLDNALTVAEGARDSVLGSFELMIARSGQRTNDIMKILTLVSVLLLPTTALAGVMGMNFKVGLFAHAWLFWAVIGVMVTFAVVTLSAARARRWI